MIQGQFLPTVRQTTLLGLMSEKERKALKDLERVLGYHRMINYLKDNGYTERYAIMYAEMAQEMIKPDLTDRFCIKDINGNLIQDWK